MAESNEAQARALLDKARRTNAYRDQQEHFHGFVAPSDGPLEVTVRTSLEALWAGLVFSDWEMVAEGAEMLGEVVGHRPWERRHV